MDSMSAAPGAPNDAPLGIRFEWMGPTEVVTGTRFSMRLVLSPKDVRIGWLVNVPLDDDGQAYLELVFVSKYDGGLSICSTPPPGRLVSRDASQGEITLELEALRPGPCPIEVEIWHAGTHLWTHRHPIHAHAVSLSWWERPANLPSLPDWETVGGWLQMAQEDLIEDPCQTVFCAEHARAEARLSHWAEGEAVACRLLATGWVLRGFAKRALEPLEHVERYLYQTGRLEELPELYVYMDQVRKQAAAQDPHRPPVLKAAEQAFYARDVESALEQAIEARSQVTGFMVVRAVMLEAECLIRLKRWDEAILLADLARERVSILLNSDLWEELWDLRDRAKEEARIHRELAMEAAQERWDAWERTFEQAQSTAEFWVNQAKLDLEEGLSEKAWAAFDKALTEAETSQYGSAIVKVHIARCQARIDAFDPVGARTEYTAADQLRFEISGDWHPLMDKLEELVTLVEDIAEKRQRKKNSKSTKEGF